MTIKVGDMVKVRKSHRDLTHGKDYKVYVVRDGGVEVIDDDGDEHFLDQWNFTHTTILTTITERMEQHMSKGEFVRAVKWAQIAEQVKELEDDSKA